MIDPIHPVEKILIDAQISFNAKNYLYGDNCKKMEPVINALFPNGLPKGLMGTEIGFNFMMKIVKLTRFANIYLLLDRMNNDEELFGNDGIVAKQAFDALVDSIHDDFIYSVMIENDLKQKGSI